MEYVSTRGQIAPVSFTEVLVSGQATDGGLFIPLELPDIRQQCAQWRSLSFSELAFEIVDLFATDIDDDVLKRLLNDAFSQFAHSDVVRMVDLGDRQILELFHGPTLAFKDIPLQVVGRLLDYVLNQRDETMNILGATSGDTGSAAIQSVRGKEAINIFILYPKGGTSRLQELQMITVMDSNVFCIAIDGSFDDCQSIMKQIFNDLEFKRTHQLGAVNSINWARLMVQIVYYIYAALHHDRPVTFAVPTGNFGNFLSGSLAMRMGAPIRSLVLGTNENDILARFFSSGDYERGQVQQTTSPSMDIQVASNLERYLYEYMGKNAHRLNEFMRRFDDTGSASLAINGTVETTIEAARVSTDEVAATINQTWLDDQYLLDPHTAVGVAASRRFTIDDPVICVATAHPAKFPEAVCEATAGLKPVHDSLSNLVPNPINRTHLPADVDAVRTFIHTHAL